VSRNSKEYASIESLINQIDQIKSNQTIKVEVWMGEHYVENFIQSLVDTAVDANGGKMLDT